MKAIISKYHSPGYRRGSRYSASDGDKNRVIVDPDPDWNADRCHREAVLKLCRKLNWKGRLSEGFLMKHGHQEGRVWVWTHFYQDSPHNPMKSETLNVD